MTKVANIVVAMVVASVAAATVVYAQNATTTQQTNYNYTNATNTTMPPIKVPSASIIIDAINAKIRSIYGGGDEKTTTRTDYRDNNNEGGTRTYKATPNPKPPAALAKNPSEK